MTINHIYLLFLWVMTREERIKAIYEAMANKKRTFGCRWRINDGEEVIFIRQNKTWSYLSIRENEEFTVSLWYTPEIIWHPVMIWDVLDWIEPYWSGHVQSVEFTERRRRKMNLVLLQRDNKRLPIDEQSDGCIDYVYSLIPSKSME